MSVARSLSVEVEKSRKLSMMNTSLGEKLIEEETAEEGSVSQTSLFLNKTKLTVCTILTLKAYKISSKNKGTSSGN